MRHTFASHFMMFQHTAARRRLLCHSDIHLDALLVSTHSRPKAAATISTPRDMPSPGFNTQPPEGGCPLELLPLDPFPVSTHSRPEAAAAYDWHNAAVIRVSTHSRAEAAAKFKNKFYSDVGVSTHSRAEAAAFRGFCFGVLFNGFNTQPREGGCGFTERFLQHLK